MRVKLKPCPGCGADSLPAIYFGLPMQFCTGTESHVWGFWSFVVLYVPHGSFMFYTGHSYVAALWHWLTSKEDASGRL